MDTDAGVGTRGGGSTQTFGAQAGGGSAVFTMRHPRAATTRSGKRVEGPSGGVGSQGLEMTLITSTHTPPLLEDLSPGHTYL